MKISIISIGKFENSPHKSVFEHYLKRIKWKVELKELELKNSLNFSSNELKNREGELILKALRPQSKLIILDENGKDFSSRNFAKLFADFALQGNSDLTFVIGGCDGLCDAIKNQSHLKISLSKLTFPHLMVRAILIEQIYRAQSIINNHPYHRD